MRDELSPCLLTPPFYSTLFTCRPYCTPVSPVGGRCVCPTVSSQHGAPWLEAAGAVEAVTAGERHPGFILNAATAFCFCFFKSLKDQDLPTYSKLITSQSGFLERFLSSLFQLLPRITELASQEKMLHLLDRCPPFPPLPPPVLFWSHSAAQAVLELLIEPRLISDL